MSIELAETGARILRSNNGEGRNPAISSSELNTF